MAPGHEVHTSPESSRHGVVFWRDDVLFFLFAILAVCTRWSHLSAHGAYDRSGASGEVS